MRIGAYFVSRPNHLSFKDVDCNFSFLFLNQSKRSTRAIFLGPVFNLPSCGLFFLCWETEIRAAEKGFFWV